MTECILFVSMSLVTGAPVLIEDRFEPEIIVGISQSVTLDCPMEGATNYEWTKKNLKLKNSAR